MIFDGEIVRPETPISDSYVSVDDEVVDEDLSTSNESTLDMCLFDSDISSSSLSSSEDEEPPARRKRFQAGPPQSQDVPKYALPIFQGVSVVLVKEGIQEKMGKYFQKFIQSSGSILTEQNISKATHVLYEQSTIPIKDMQARFENLNVVHVTYLWIVDSLKKRKVLKDLRYRVQLNGRPLTHKLSPEVYLHLKAEVRQQALDVPYDDAPSSPEIDEILELLPITYRKVTTNVQPRLFKNIRIVLDDKQIELKMGSELVRFMKQGGTVLQEPNIETATHVLYIRNQVPLDDPRVRAFENINVAHISYQWISRCLAKQRLLHKYQFTVLLAGGTRLPHDMSLQRFMALAHLNVIP